MNPVMDKLLVMFMEDLAALVDDPDAHLHTVRVNLTNETTYVTGSKDVNVSGKVKVVPEPKETVELFRKFWGMAAPYVKSFMKEREQP